MGNSRAISNILARQTILHPHTRLPQWFPSAWRPPGFCHGRVITSQRHAPLAVAFFQKLRVEPSPPPQTDTRTTRGRELGPTPMRPRP